MSSTETLFFFLLFAFLGVSFEVLWVSILDFINQRNKKLKGHSSIWMYLVYGCSYFVILFVTTYFGQYNFFIRGLIYMFLFYLIEFTSGFILKKSMDAAPWDYALTKKYHFNGLICLEYAPLWFFAGLTAETFYLFMKVHIIF